MSLVFPLHRWSTRARRGKQDGGADRDGLLSRGSMWVRGAVWTLLSSSPCHMPTAEPEPRGGWYGER